MNCPVCREAMVVFEWDHVEVDHCLSCSGIWLDGGELGLLFKSSEDKARILSSFETCDIQNPKPRKCPICFKKMDQVLCGSSTKVLIDRCPKHHGLWFDAGELDAILKTEIFAGQTKVSNWLKSIFSRTADQH